MLLVYLILMSCTEVVEVDVPTEAPRLVVEATISWELGTPGNEQTIKLSNSTPYFNSIEIVPAKGASVKITDDFNGEIFTFSDQNNGEYFCNNFVPIINQSYTLEVIYNGEIYLANETLTSVVPIDEVYQSTDQGFDKNALEVNILFTDPANVENFYLTKFQEEGALLPALFDISDEFTNGNQMKVFYEKFETQNSDQQEFEPGDIVNISLFGISKQFYNYIGLLLEQSQEGGPFSTIPAQIKGNCLNISNDENYAFGYFRLTQVSKKTYEFVE
jgi:hypothetical protein